MERRKIVNQAREQMLTSAKSHFKSIINNLIANGEIDEITDWGDEFYSIDLADYGKRLIVARWVTDAYTSEDYVEKNVLCRLDMDENGDIWCVAEYLEAEPFRITELNTDDFQSVIDVLIEIDK